MSVYKLKIPIVFPDIFFVESFLLGYCFSLIAYDYAYKQYVVDWRSFGCEASLCDHCEVLQL